MHKAAVLYGAKDIRIEDVETPKLRPHEVRVAPRATGICGTDLHYYQNGKNGIYTVRQPLVLGHEAAGEIVEVGSGVSNLKPGDRVVVEPQLACSACQQCRLGKYNLCRSMRFNGSASASPPAQGSLQKLWTHAAYLCYPLPETITFAEGAMVEPLSVALHSVRKAKLKAGHSVFVTGAGAIGLLCARVARISGAATITMVDVDEARLEFAKKHGIADRTYTIPMDKEKGETGTEFSMRMSTEIQELLKIPQANVAFDCTGIESCLNICIGMAGPGSRVVVVGMGRPVQEVNVGLALIREIEIVGVWRYANTFQPAIQLIEAVMVDVKSLVTHRFEMEDVASALEFALQRPADLVNTGVTGYIAGDAVYALAAAYPEIDFTFLVRTQEKANSVQDAYPHSRIVRGDLDNYTLLEQESATADIVLHAADASDHESAARAIAAGLARGHTKERPGYWLHTGGTGILCYKDSANNFKGLGQWTDEQYDDLEGINSVVNLPDEAFHRNVDKIVLEAGTKNKDIVKTVIICPPTIYGTGRGPIGQRGRQVYEMAKLILSQGFIPVVGQGKARWTNIHVADLSNVYKSLALKAIAHDISEDIWGMNGYMFVENGEHVWTDLAQVMAKEALERGYIKDPQHKSLSKDAAIEQAGFEAVSWGLNSRARAERARQYLDWRADRPSLEETVPEIIRQEHDRLSAT
ncbi:NAD(P)-binding protein [Aureobasidium subglaciale]|nr:NAD(P)-binding protein [Aureobasidium subglaciale]